MQSMRENHGNDIDEISHIVDNGFIEEPENGIMADMRLKYKQNCLIKEQEHANDIWNYTKLSKSLQEQPIYATKYNHNLEGAIMNHY